MSLFRVDEGIRTIAPIVSGYVSVRDETLQLLGVDVFAEREFRQFTAPASLGSDIAGESAAGRVSGEQMVSGFLAGRGDVLLTPDTAARLGLGEGQAFTVVADGRQHPARVGALIGGDSQAQLGNVVIVDIAVAQRWLSMPGKLSRIDVRLDNAAAEKRLAAAITDGTSMLSASGRTQATADMSKAFMTNLSAMSLPRDAGRHFPDLQQRCLRGAAAPGSDRNLACARAYASANGRPDSW